jgi:putative colanic acid biosynthesis acetyltransferase WcaB
MYLFQDWKANKGNIKGRLIMLAFRAVYWMRSLPVPIWLLGIPFLVLYRICIEWILGVELPFKTKVGKGLVIQHGQGLVVNDGTVIGKYCTLRNGCTIGIKKDSAGVKSKAPVLGDRVDMGANTVIIGPIEIGSNVMIGAGSIVVKSIPSNSVVVGNPAQVIKQL